MIIHASGLACPITHQSARRQAAHPFARLTGPTSGHSRGRAGRPATRRMDIRRLDFRRVDVRRLDTRVSARTGRRSPQLTYDLSNEGTSP
jgi:hypothetical protein